jgi:hypothetical protein
MSAEPSLVSGSERLFERSPKLFYLALFAPSVKFVISFQNHVCTSLALFIASVHQ